MTNQKFKVKKKTNFHYCQTNLNDENIKEITTPTTMLRDTL